MKSKPSFKVKQWANRQKISGKMKAVLNVLADYANREGIAWPSQDSIAQRSGCCVRSVRSALSDLERFGVIKRQARSKGRHGRTSDLITLSTHRDFEITNSDVRLARLQPAKSAGRSKSSNRQNLHFQPANLAGELPRELPDISLASRVPDIRKGIPVISGVGLGGKIPAGRVLH